MRKLFIMSFLAVMFLTGCGSSGGSSTKYYGEGLIDNPTLIVENGTYKTVDHLSYYKTRMLEADCTVRIEINKDIEDLVVYDGDHIVVPYNFEYNTYTFRGGDTDDWYELVVKDYTRTTFNFSAGCLDDLSRP